MNSYTENKRPKSPELCKTITKVLTKDRRENGYTKEEQSHEIGLNVGTLENKLKPSHPTGDITLSEFIHILEITGNYEPLKLLNSMFDLVTVTNKVKIHSTAQKISIYTDAAQLESNDVFSVAKRAISDGVVTEDEKNSILKEIEESQEATATLKASVENLEVGE